MFIIYCSSIISGCNYFNNMAYALLYFASFVRLYFRNFIFMINKPGIKKGQ